ncbi:MAG TPA: abhydrolase domain-containing 18 [Blastocatellia bacterium]|nr:abhydrolase domain-containing 18 [Blastocatellia bacterium]
MLRPLMHHLEKRLHARDMDLRVTHPFDWGLEFLGESSEVRQLAATAGGNQSATAPCSISPREFLRQYNGKHLANSEAFFTPTPSRPDDFDFDGFWLRFPSSLVTPYKNNNTVQARFFPVHGDRAVIVSPQWNAQTDSHVGLCTVMNRFGISALRLSLPYHDGRMPDGFTRADYMVSGNIGRTIQSVRQSVLDIRRAADWLFAQGYKQVGLAGTSIGSCVSWLAFIHDERLSAGVFNMVSSWFGDVVWRALTTSHIRRALEAEVNAEEIREVWKVISPAAYAHKLAEVRRPALCISNKYDLTFLPDLSEIFLDDCRRHGMQTEIKYLPCGHYTIGRTPFKYIDAFHIVNFFRRIWSATPLA